MVKVSARDVALTMSAAAIGAAIALWFRLPDHPDENNMLGLMGSLIGAAIAVAASLAVLARQFETTDERHLRTVRQLLHALKDSGAQMASQEGSLNPPKYVWRAYSALQAALSVARELQATGPNLAAVAQLLDESDARDHLTRLKSLPPDAGIAPDDILLCGKQTVALADAALEKLTDGL